MLSIRFLFFYLVTPTAETIGLPAMSIDDVDLDTLPPPPDFLLDATSHDDDVNGGGDQSVDDAKKQQQLIAERSLSVAEAVKSLNEIRHQPASPGVVRRVQSMRLSSDSMLDGKTRTHISTNSTTNCAFEVLAGDHNNRSRTGSNTFAPAKAPGTLPKGRLQQQQHQHQHLARNHSQGHAHMTLHHSLSVRNQTKVANNHTKTLPKLLPTPQQLQQQLNVNNYHLEV